MKRTSTKSERDHMKKVSEIGCILCLHVYGIEDSLAQVHHVRVNHGWGRSSHFMTIPLCIEHHTGKTGVHSMGRNEFEAMHGFSEMELLAVVHAKLGIE